MKIGTIKLTLDPAAFSGARTTGAPPPPATGDLEISLGKILGFFFSTAGITALTALVSVFLVQGPKTKAEVDQARAKIELDARNFQLDVLHTALTSEKPEERKTSINLFIHARLLDSTLLQYVDTVDTLPQLPPRSKPAQAAKP